MQVIVDKYCEIDVLNPRYAITSVLEKFKMDVTTEYNCHQCHNVYHNIQKDVFFLTLDTGDIRHVNISNCLRTYQTWEHLPNRECPNCHFRGYVYSKAEITTINKYVAMWLFPGWNPIQRAPIQYQIDFLWNQFNVQLKLCAVLCRVKQTLVCIYFCKR